MLDISLTVSPIKDAEGKITGASKIARDITERRRAQEQQELLVGEIQHRIKNTLATVQAIATQTLRDAPNECEAFVARLHALAAAHDLLKDDNWQQAPLVDLVDRALHAFQEQHRQRFLIDGPGGNLPRCAEVFVAGHGIARARDKRHKVRRVVEWKRSSAPRVGNATKRATETTPTMLAGDRRAARKPSQTKRVWIASP